MENRAVVGLDLDGTLLGKDRILTEHTVATLKKAAEAGVVPVIDSGRKFEVVPPRLRELPFLRYYVLCNGAEIYDKWEDRILYQAEIPLEKTLTIYDALTDHPEVYLDCYAHDISWARAEDYARIDEFVSDPSHREVLHHTRTPVENYREALVKRNKGIYKFQTIYMNTEIRDREMDRIKKLFPDMYVTMAYPYNMEVNMPQATKGKGLLKLAEILGLPREKVFAFGDSGNDLSMIECAGTGYAMANGDAIIKAAADRIAPPNTQDGVAQVLEELFDL